MYPSSRFLAPLILLSLGIACSHEPPQASSRVFSAPAFAASVPRAKPVSNEQPRAASIELPRSKETPSIFFDFDSAQLRGEAQPVLQTMAGSIRERSDTKLRIEGNCDQLGTVEYNLALGEERARAAKTYLVHMGVPGDHIATVSFGSQRPKYSGDNDETRAKNRRDDFIVIR